MKLSERLKRELDSFRGIWRGGYYAGDPLEPMGSSDYAQCGFGYMSVLHVVYLTCIKPYVKSDTTVLEIGAGRGAWTKTMLEARAVWCLDALSAEHNGFWRYLGHGKSKQTNVQYFQVSDFSCSMLPDDTFDYLFSFGTLCHISFDGITEYMRNVYPKLKKGAHAFVMISDYEKYNRALDEIDRLGNIGAFRGQRRIERWLMAKWWQRERERHLRGRRRDLNENDVPIPGRWYNAGIERTSKMLEEIGYTVIDPDVGAVHRDAIVHFVK